jgi:hypothetical protein
MDATSTKSLHYGATPAPVLAIGSSDQAMARARQTIAASQLRLADCVAVEDAPARLADQSRASAIWVELDGSDSASFDRLLDSVSRDAEDGRFPAIVAAPVSLIDPLVARLSDSVQLVIDGSEADRAAALAIALATGQGPTRLSDVASDRNTARLRQLSDEVSRIASTLARISAEAPAPAPELQKPTEGNVPDVPVEAVRSVIRARRLRTRFFPDDLFADPGWDMILDLLQAEIAQLRVPVSSLCIAAAVPATTALRWLKNMVEQGLFLRRADPHDARRVFVELAPPTSLAIRRYFAEVGKPAVV